MHDPTDISRRQLLKTAPIAAGIAIVASTAPASGQTKLTHEVAKYQSTPKNGQQCSTCVNFVAPSSCQIVQSPISPNGWCQFYSKKPA